MKTIVKRTLAAAGLVAALASPALASGNAGGPQLDKQSWSWTGLFGGYSEKQLKNGFEVYRQVCANCHPLKHLYYRDLLKIGYTETEVKDIAARYQVKDGPDDNGEMFDRPATPADHFVGPFANDKIAAMINGGAVPPDLSLMTKARKQGPDYVYNLLHGFASDAPGQPAEWWLKQQEKHGLDATFPETKYFNDFFPGYAISMPPQLREGAVTLPNGKEPSVDEMARDVVTFLNWAAEPELESRKTMGLLTLLYLGVLTTLLFGLKKYIWRNVHH
ncbi:cytochrome c1 [Pararhodospirillum photometricum]|uniref:Cytochrome c1 n=1 Tax=Pararhodospirillum photometricum DSM 122 TaxID=1150469 RepID=H6SSA2_PARPM|nr:cytochrome c1 [Pararhodospirillum photometricum]CCG07781.1 Cytochrome c1 [Pararhodospirillum photometricum DSM 122]